MILESRIAIITVATVCGIAGYVFADGTVPYTKCEYIGACLNEGICGGVGGALCWKCTSPHGYHVCMGASNKNCQWSNNPCGFKWYGSCPGGYAACVYDPQPHPADQCEAINCIDTA